jgi:two-component system, OmpR family, response regulator ChvI
LALEDSGLFQVEKYTDPLIALSNLKPNQYDVLLLDIKMPNIDSFKLYAKMKKVDSKLKVCFIGLYNDKKTYRALRKQFPSLEIDCFMPKPVKIQSLINRINAQLGR